MHGSWVGGQIAHSLAEEGARFLGRRPNRLTVLLKSVHGSWVGGQIAHSLAEERARFLGRRPNRSQSWVKSVHGSWVGGQIAHSLAEERARFLGQRPRSLTVLLKSAHGSWVGGQIAHSLAEERARFLGRRPNRSQPCRRACTVLGSAAKSLTALPKSVHGSWVGGQIAHSLAEERARFLGRRPNRSQPCRRACTVLGSAAKSLTALPKSVHGSWVGGQIAHSLAEERARFLGWRPNRSKHC